MRTSIAIAVLAIAAAAAEQPSDLTGWGRIEWGMTLQQARDTYRAETRETADAYWTHLELPAVKVGVIPLKVIASARKPDPGIRLVSLFCSFGLPGDAPIAPSEFETLRTALIQKYGRPKSHIFKVEYDDPVELLLWPFPSGSVTLTLRQKRNAPHLGSMSIDYRAAEGKDVL
jgi:hypothetical protein